MGIYLTQLTAYVQTSHRALAHPSYQDPRTLKTNPNHCDNIDTGSSLSRSTLFGEKFD